MDRDRILDDFEHCCHGDCYACGAGPECQYIDHTIEGGLALMPVRLRDKVLALLKEQNEQVQIAHEEGFHDGYMQAMSEAKPVKRVDGKRNHFLKCGGCNTDLMSGMKFCPQCGRKVKWE